MTDLAINDQQGIALWALAEGYSPEKAAELAGVRPLMIDLWRRNEVAFQRALLDIHYNRAIQFREQALALAERAFKALGNLLDDRTASPTVRLRAATYLVETAITPPRYQPPKPMGLLELPMDIARRVAGLPPRPRPGKDKD